MASWEIDVEFRVRKTLSFSGPTEESMVREIVLASLRGQGVTLDVLQKVEPDPMRSNARPVYVEEIIDNDPQIVGVRRVGE